MIRITSSGASFDVALAERAAEAALAAAAERLAAAVRDGLSTPPGGSHERPWKRTGGLAASVGVSAEGDQAVVGSSHPAAVPQECGTGAMPPRPFLAPAAVAIGGELARSIGAAVAEALRDGAASDSAARSGTSQGAVTTVQSFLIAPRPWFLFTDPPKGVLPRPMQRVPRQSGKEAASDLPSWARGKPRYVGETPTDYAKRLMDEQYGPENWQKGPGSDFNKIKKFGERAFQDPKMLYGIETESEPEA